VTSPALTAAGAFTDPRSALVVPAWTALAMSLIMSGVITAVNTGLDAGFFGRWLHAWLIAWPLATLSAYLARPFAARMSGLTLKGWDRLAGRRAAP